jgi:hypothetical protein
VDYALIEIEILGPPSASSNAEPTLGERIAALLRSFGRVASGVLVVLTGLVVYGIPAILLLAFLFWLLFGRVGLIKKLWRLAAGKKAQYTVSDRTSGGEERVSP